MPGDYGFCGAEIRRHHLLAASLTGLWQIANSWGSSGSPDAGPLGHAVRSSSALPAQNPGPIGIISNFRAHKNQAHSKRLYSFRSNMVVTEPATRCELNLALAQFRYRSVETIIVDGGDGTVRDVLSLAGRHYGEELPRLIVVPSGKTNALAHDLGIPARFKLQDALSCLPRMRLATRSPIEIRYRGGNRDDLRGFMFGAGAFVRATRLAQGLHRMGAFSGLAVGSSLAAGIIQSVFARDANDWRRGEHMTVQVGSEAAVGDWRYLFLASTLQRLPSGIRPFGAGLPGMRLLSVAAPPRLLAVAAPILLAGRYPALLKALGYRQCATQSVHLTLGAQFILDGEVFPGGDLTIRQCRPVEFLVPD